MKEANIVERLLDGDEEFKELYLEHRKLDDIVKGLEDKEIITFDDELEIKKLKKIKLSLKDKMELKISKLK
ncbi:DUF465 domain-containing protein [Desulfobacterota bacterium AH_259_B03_O07]|nr:DUF465 domain-containing protein [Desulfobacterota bacterium AH_259_B03_O07]